MISLFIDTSSSDVSIAIVRDNKILASKNEVTINQHSVYTTSFLDEVLKEANIKPFDVDRIMVVNGPGSFTGVRIGVTIAKVYAYLLGIDINCVSSLKMRALSCNHNYCLSLIDAHHNNYYMGLYDKENNEVLDEVFADKEMVLKIIDKYNPVIVGDNDFYVDDIFVKRVNLDVLKIVDYYKNSDVINCHFVVPNYLKLPQALENLK